MKVSYKIAVIGAGPAGCLLANLLHQNNIDVVVYEGEASPEARSQGGSLDLHKNGGLAALKECGLFAEFEKHARYDGEAIAFADKLNQRYIAMNGADSSANSRGAPEIDRNDLRQLLAKPLSDRGLIYWNHRLKSVGADGTLHFVSGATAGGYDLVVGADGAWSKVRTLLTDEVPVFAGVGGFEGRIRTMAEGFSHISQLVNRGSWMGLGDQRSIGCQQQGDGSIATSFWRAYRADGGAPYSLNDPAALKAALHEEYHDWSDDYHKVIDAVDPTSFLWRPIYQLPPGLSWETRPGFTLIGDAAHLMSPFAGEGVNCAMADACELAKAIRKSVAHDGTGRNSLSSNVARFEDEMQKRIAPIRYLSQANLEDWYYNVDAPRAIVEQFLIRNLVFQLGSFLRLPISALVYTYFYFVKRKLEKAPRAADLAGEKSTKEIRILH